jgi:periplasmic copper chaperone A
MLAKFRLLALWAALMLLISSTAFSETMAQMIEIKAPVIDSQIAKNEAAQVYMQIKNNTANTYEIVAATSPAASKIQFREPGNTISSSEKIRRSIILPKNSEKDLQVGGLHVLLIGLKKSLVPGEAVPLTLIFSDGSWVTVNATVN